MKQYSFSLARDVRLGPIAAEQSTEIYDPAQTRDYLNRSLRRRVSDDLESLIRKACARGHTATAEELLTVLRNLIEWEKQHFPHGRRPVDAQIERLAGEVAAAKLGRDAA